MTDYLQEKRGDDRERERQTDRQTRKRRRRWWKRRRSKMESTGKYNL